MKKAWLHKTDDIAAEMLALCQDKASLTFCQQGELSQASSLQEVVLRQGKETILVMAKGDGFRVGPEGYFAFYRRQGQKMLRGFQGYIIQEGQRFFLASCPTTMFKVQRRHQPRILTPSPSAFTMSSFDSHRLFHGQVLDVSLKGCCLQGNFADLRPGQDMGPLTMTLYQTNERLGPVVVLVSQARLVRVAESDGLWTASLQFQQQNCDHDAIENYLEGRTIEAMS
ncbi:MAG: PilZ domain-containing protein [Thermodesulfobacteriota bacterium]